MSKVNNGENGSSLPRQVQRVQAALDALEAEQKGKTGEEQILSGQAPGQPQDHAHVEDQKPKPPVADENLEQKFKVLKGKYDSEVPALTARVRELTGEKGELLQELSYLKGQLQTVQESAGRQTAEDDVKPQDKRSEIDPSQYEEYGPEIVDLATAYRDQGATLAQLDAKLRGLEKSAEGIQENQRVQSVAEFEKELTKLCPGWKNQNNDQNFINWLAQNGLNESLNAAGERLDFEKVANIFNMYLKLNSTPESPSKPEPEPKPEEKKPEQSELEDYIVPKTGGSGESPQSQPSFSREEVNLFYRAVARGKYPFSAGPHLVSNREEADKLDKIITHASSLGLIR